MFRTLLFLRRDCGHKSFDFNIHLRLQKTSEMSKSLENNILCRTIDLVMVFDAILTSMQTCEKLQCLYEKWMSSNFNKTAVLKKISIYCKLKLQSKGLSCFRFSTYLSEIFPGLSYWQMCRKYKKVVLGLLVHVTPLIFFSRILRSKALVYKSYFFRRAFFRKLFDIRFSYKHCHFSRVCLLVKMASKSETRSIQSTFKINVS